MTIFRVPQILGVNNVDHSLSSNAVQFDANGDITLSGDLTACVNFRITKDGIAATRNGQTLKLTGTSAHSYWVDKTGTRAYFVDGTALKQLNADFTATTIATVTAGARMCFEEHYGPSYEYMIFCGNGHQMLKIKDGVVSAWADTSLKSTEFDPQQRVYRGLPNTNIIMSYFDRMWAADGRFALYSESTDPTRFRRSQVIPIDGEITAMSHDNGAVYLHAFDFTVSLVGRGPDDFQMQVFPIGAIKHGAISIRNMAYMMTPKGWAIAHDGIVEYVDEGNFRLDLPRTAEAFMGYNDATKEIICPIRS